MDRTPALHPKYDVFCPDRHMEDNVPDAFIFRARPPGRFLNGDPGESIRQWVYPFVFVVGVLEGEPHIPFYSFSIHISFLFQFCSLIVFLGASRQIEARIRYNYLMPAMSCLPAGRSRSSADRTI